MQESAQATKIEISKVTSKSKSGRSKILSFVENNMDTIIYIGMAFGGRFMGFSWIEVITMVIISIIFSILKSLVFLVIKKTLTWMKIFRTVIPIAVAVMNVVGLNELFMKVLIFDVGQWSTDEGGYLLMEVATGILWYVNVFSVVLGRWRPMTTKKVVAILAMTIWMMYLSSYGYDSIYDKHRCEFKQDLIVGNILSRGVGDQRIWIPEVSDPKDSLRFDVMMEDFMKPIFTSLKGESCIESITIAGIEQDTIIANATKKNIVISAEDFLPEGTLPAGDIEARLTSALYNIINGVAHIKSGYFSNKYFL